MEIESPTRSRSPLSFSLPVALLSLSPSFTLPLSTFFSSTYEPCTPLSRTFCQRWKPYGVTMTTIVPLSLPPPPSLHLLAPPFVHPRSPAPTAPPTSPSQAGDYSAAVPAPLLAAQQPIQQPHRCVPHLSNDLLLMLYQLTLQTGPLSLLHPSQLSLPSSSRCLPSLRLARPKPLPRHPAPAVCNPSQRVS